MVFLIDLKMAGFIILLLGLAFVALLYLLWQRRGLNRKDANRVWQLYETLPFGIVISHPAQNKPLFYNLKARQLLSHGGTDEDTARDKPEIQIQKVIDRLTGSAETALANHDPSVQQTGLIHQPAFIRWWSFYLENGERLVVLAEAADQQRFLRQQAFVGQLVHELRTPLTALVAHAELVASERTSEPVRQASVQTLQSGAQRMARLVRDMLELYRVETAEELVLQPLNLALVAEDAIAQVILEADERGIILEFEAETPLPPVAGHSDRLKQVFLNLLDNALKYCRPGDEVRVRLTKTPDGIVCTVRDSGPGIPATELPHVTERLYRGRRQTGEIDGNGIGLALVCEILRHHHTTLSIQSETLNTATGTTCHWLLPYSRS